MQKQNLGQVFLQDKNILKKIIRKAEISKNEVVVEVGVGEGILTEQLALLAKKLYVVEIDSYYLNLVKEKMQKFDNISYIFGDVLKLEFNFVTEERFRIIANIPYYISAKFIKLLIENRKKIAPSLIMVQKEFAKKLVAKPGSKDYKAFTCYSSFYLDAKILFTVSKNSFKPKPEVDSAILYVVPKQNHLFKIDEDLFFKIIRAGFWGRRKPLLSCLKKSPFFSKIEGLEKLGFFRKYKEIRAEMCSLQMFYELYQEFKKIEK